MHSESFWAHATRYARELSYSIEELRIRVPEALVKWNKIKITLRSQSFTQTSPKKALQFVNLSLILSLYASYLGKDVESILRDSIHSASLWELFVKVNNLRSTYLKGENRQSNGLKWRQTLSATLHMRNTWIKLRVSRRGDNVPFVPGAKLKMPFNENRDNLSAIRDKGHHFTRG